VTRRFFPILTIVIATLACQPRIPDEGRKVTMEGEIVDPQCLFTHEGRGTAHRSCALMCARGGQDLAFMNRVGERVLPIIADRHGRNPNAGLYAVVGYPVLVQGTIYARGKDRVLRVDRVERLDVQRAPRSRASG
jgi:hypothetical protein